MSLTASHHELDLEALEQLSSGARSIGSSAVQACQMIAGAVVLATCNRFEVYLDVSAEAPPTERDLLHASQEVARLIAVESGVSVDAALSAFTVRSGLDVAEHLFSVASGLDSMVVGEREIAGQVRRALDAAHAAGTTTAQLERLFQRASRTSKKVSQLTHLGADGRSVVSVGLDLAEAAIPPWRQTRVVIVGTGAYAGASVAALRARGCTDVSVYSASGRAEAFAQARGVQAAPDLVAALSDADLVVSCSGAGVRRPLATGADTAPADSLEYILHTASVLTARERAAERMGERLPPRPLVILDLALHRDVDPLVGDIDHVLLMDLGTIRAHVPAAGSEPVQMARAIVAQAAAEYGDLEAVRAADRIVVALRERILTEVEAEIRRTEGSFSTAADAAAHEKSLRRLGATLLHRAISRIREATRNGTPLDEIEVDLTLTGSLR